MRLNCPNCGTGYEVPDGMIPTGGRHVQCTDCHTRWFVRGATRPMLSEDQIISRLEARTRPKPVPVPDPAPVGADTTMQWSAEDLAEAFVWEGIEPASTPATPAEPATAASTAEPPWAPLVAGPFWTAPVPTSAVPPPLPQPRPFPSGATEAEAQPTPASLPRPGSRIDLTADSFDEPAADSPRSQFARGLLLTLGLFALALIAYRAHEAIASRLPAAAPALDAYVAAIDALRQDIATRLGVGADDG